jgi:hypothetical protein
MFVTLRHAAALALLGWYLMTPPVVCIKHVTGEKLLELDGLRCTVETVAPLWQWVRLTPHDSASDCEAALQQQQQRAEMLGALNTNIAPQADVELDEANAKLSSLWNSKCVATDDPGLKP